MRIAFVTEVWHPSINGVVTRLAMTVEKLLADGHEVLVLAPKLDAAADAAAAAEHAHPGLTVHKVPSFRISFVYGGQPWGLPLPVVDRRLAEFRPDLVHVVNPFMIGIAGVVSARRRRYPLVASFHTDIAAYARFYHLGWIRPLIWLLLRLLHGAAAVNLVTSTYSATLLASHGIGNIRLWRRGVDLELFRPRADAVPVKGPAGGTSPGDPAEPDAAPAISTALYVGRLAYEKGLHRLLPLAKDPSVRLVMVGDGPDKERLVAEFEGTGAVFTGSKTGDELARIYSGSDVFVFPSTTETLGLVLLEALASGIPVVAAESPASHELLASSAAARLFPADRADLAPVLVKELLASAPEAVLAQTARAEAEGWGWRQATDELLGYYADVLSGSREPSPAIPETATVKPYEPRVGGRAGNRDS
jgi:glycosyltransferase involved in cell wall biosynthesis